MVNNPDMQNMQMNDYILNYPQVQGQMTQEQIQYQQYKEKDVTMMTKISKEQYELALARIEELLPLVDDNTPANDRNAVELTLMSDVVIEYEKEHYPIGKPTVAQLIQLSLEEKNMSQKQLASQIGVSPSRINDYVSGRAEPTLKIARLLCMTLGISPAAMLGY